jgi:alanyl-tRNA synthetase
LCGGTHTHHSGELGAVVIANESGIGSGKRRIVGYAGQAALAHLKERLHLLETLTERVGARTPEELEARVDSVLQELEALKREVQRRQQQQAHHSASDLVSRAREIDGVQIVVAALESSSSEDLERMVDATRQELRSGVVVLGSVFDGRVPFVVGVTRDLTARVHAGKIVGEIGRKAGGGGGGARADFAKGGGTQPAQLGAALQHAFEIVERALQED